jgi:hypothetical protein
MKFTITAVIALASADAVVGYSVNRSSLRQLGHKSVATTSQQHKQVGASIKMEGASPCCQIAVANLPLVSI